MRNGYPSQVLITGGREVGGLTSFAEGLRAGFTELGIAVEIISPLRIFLRWRDLRNPRILKILSTSAVFAVPLARRAICVAHGCPCAALQGWLTTISVLVSLKLAAASSGAQLVAVSDYTALQLRAIFAMRVDAAIRNPILPLFLEASQEPDSRRVAIAYVGRLHRAKNVDRLLPAIRDVLDENPGLRAWIVGDGPMRGTLERIAAGDQRIEFLGALPPDKVRDRLRRSRVFVSGNPTEPFGIAYLEALSQGCAVAMPASGGGLEIAPELIGRRIFLFSSSINRHAVVASLRNALHARPMATTPDAYSACAVAEAYLARDLRFTALGAFPPEPIQ